MDVSRASSLATGAAELLASALRLDEPGATFPWQRTLLETMQRGDLPSALDLPTGLGKTSVIAIWLVARILGAPVPRRLVYVVDRRAVVDQATAEAERLRAWVQDSPERATALALPRRALPISTLRGQHVDNREWLEDPSIPAIIVGTVDMIGSRLLFEGYGASRKIRPYHAALLACDTLFIIDEAHLIPAFEALMVSISSNATLHASRISSISDQPRRLHILALTATQRTSSGSTCTLSTHDTEHPVVAQRIHATKHLQIVPPSTSGRLADDLVTATWSLCEELKVPFTCIVFCDARETAVLVANELRKRGKANVDVELFVGARRVAERVEAQRRLWELGFIAGHRNTVDKPRFLVATSAAEVGVDLDAEHLVGDVVAWERMVQRLGRVNRRGQHPAHVRVVATPSETLKKLLDNNKKGASTEESENVNGADAMVQRYQATLELLKKLPVVDGKGHDASPASLRNLARTHSGLVEAATTPAPLHPALDRATLDAWAMTSLREHAGRPTVTPWLRGWVEDEPRVSIVWRRFLPAPKQGSWAPAQQRAFIEAVPPHTSEVLEVEVSRALSWLKDRVATLMRLKKDPKTGISLQSLLAVTLDSAGELVRTFTLGDLITDEKLETDVSGRRGVSRRNAIRLERDDLPGATFIVDARFGGLSQGLLDGDCDEAPTTADGEDSWLITDKDAPPVIRFRVTFRGPAIEPKSDKNWRERLRLPWVTTGDGDVSELIVVEKWRHDAATEEDRSAGNPQLLADHQAWTEARAVALGKRLGLGERALEILRIAARLHDEGKRAARWQRAMRAPTNDIYAKTRGPVAPTLLDGYRHEFGSLKYIVADPDFQKLNTDDQDLVLHIVAAHHGYARPLIAVSGVDDSPPSLLPEQAQAIALRYFRLSERWGPWGLAWWESLLRAADQQASRDNDMAGSGGR